MSSVEDNDDEEYLEPPPTQLHSHICVFGGVYAHADDLAQKLARLTGEVVWAHDLLSNQRFQLSVHTARFGPNNTAINVTFTYLGRVQYVAAKFGLAGDIGYDYSVYDSQAWLPLDGTRVVVVRAADVVKNVPPTPAPRRVVRDTPNRRTPPRVRPTQIPIDLEEPMPDAYNDAFTQALTQAPTQATQGTAVLGEDEDDDEEELPEQMDLSEQKRFSPAVVKARRSPIVLRSAAGFPAPPRPSRIPAPAVNPPPQPGKKKWPGL